MRFFKKYNIPSGPKPLPLLGNMIGIIKNGFKENDKQLINKYGNIFGYFEGTSPIIICADKELLKNILQKDFFNFVNRRVLK